jgi:hypothetical protein
MGNCSEKRYWVLGIGYWGPGTGDSGTEWEPDPFGRYEPRSDESPVPGPLLFSALGLHHGGLLGEDVPPLPTGKCLDGGEGAG